MHNMIKDIRAAERGLEVTVQPSIIRSALTVTMITPHNRRTAQTDQKITSLATAKKEDTRTELEPGT